MFFSNAAIELSEKDYYLLTEKLEHHFPQKPQNNNMTPSPAFCLSE